MSETPEKREPYEPPAVMSEETFETLSLQCGKVDISVPSCNPEEGGMGSTS